MVKSRVCDVDDGLITFEGYLHSKMVSAIKVPIDYLGTYVSTLSKHLSFGIVQTGRIRILWGIVFY
jgi:hypothetical protein